MNYFKKILNSEERKRFTIFFGQNASELDGYNPKSAFLYSKHDDTYYVNCQKFDKSKYADIDILDKTDIKSHFDLINIAEQDKVFIGLESKEEIPKSFWQRNRFENK